MVSIDDCGGNPLLFIKSTLKRRSRDPPPIASAVTGAFFSGVQGSELRLRPDDQREASPGLNTFKLYLDLTSIDFFGALKKIFKFCFVIFGREWGVGRGAQALCSRAQEMA